MVSSSRARDVTELTLAKEHRLLYILSPSETNAGSAGEQPARDSWVTMINPSSRREDLTRLPAFYFWVNHCPMPKKTQTSAPLTVIPSFSEIPPGFHRTFDTTYNFGSVELELVSMIE